MKNEYYILGTPLCDDCFEFKGKQATGLWVEIKSPVDEETLNPQEDMFRLTVSLSHDKGITINNKTEYDVSLYKLGVLVPEANGNGEEVLYISNDEFKDILPLLTDVKGCYAFISEYKAKGITSYLAKNAIGSMRYYLVEDDSYGIYAVLREYDGGDDYIDMLDEYGKHIKAVYITTFKHKELAEQTIQSYVKAYESLPIIKE